MKKAIGWLINQPDNPNMPRPIFVVGLAMFLIIGGIYLLNNREENIPPTSPPTTDTEEVSMVSRLIYNIKNIFTKENEPTNIVDSISLPQLPRLSTEDQELDESLIKAVDNIGHDKYEIHTLSLIGLGRKDPMRPLKPENIEIYRYEAYEDDVFFFPINYLDSIQKDETVEDLEKKQNENTLQEDTEEDNGENNEEDTEKQIEERKIVRYVSWEEAKEHKVPSQEAIDYRENEDHSNYNIKYVAEDLIDDTKFYFEGMTLNQVILDIVCINERLIPTATFISIGGEYKGLKEGDYLNAVYYISDIDYLDQTATLEYVSNDEIKNHTFKASHIKYKSCMDK